MSATAQNDGRRFPLLNDQTMTPAQREVLTSLLSKYAASQPKEEPPAINPYLLGLFIFVVVGSGCHAVIAMLSLYPLCSLVPGYSERPLGRSPILSICLSGTCSRLQSS